MCGPHRPRALVVLTAIVAVLALSEAAAPPASALTTVLSPRHSADEAAGQWVWPLEAFRIARPWEAPAHRYGPGHRGIDLAPLSGAAVRAPADGVIAFAGPVAGRGVLTIEHRDGYVTTLEPVTTSLAVGTAVEGGQVVAEIAGGGHAEAGTLHFGVRLHGDYINPMSLFGAIPRAILLPCCDDLP